MQKILTAFCACLALAACSPDTSAKDARIAALEARSAERDSEITEMGTRIEKLLQKLEEAAVDAERLGALTKEIEILTVEKEYLDEILKSGQGQELYIMAKNSVTQEKMLEKHAKRIEGADIDISQLHEANRRQEEQMEKIDAINKAQDAQGKARTEDLKKLLSDKR